MYRRSSARIPEQSAQGRMPAKVPIELEVIVTHPAWATAKASARTGLMRQAYINITITVPQSASSTLPTA